MLIGIDASRAQIDQKTGTENYSYHLIKNLVEIDSHNNYTLYQKNTKSFENLPSNFQIQTINLPRLWTQAGLAWKCLLKPPDVLFIPAHTLPIVRRPGLKTVVTIHDLGAQFLPQYHRFPPKLYLNKSTEYAVRHATHLIAVSESTKKDLVKKLGANPEKISVVYEGVDIEKFKTQKSQPKAGRPLDGKLKTIKEKYKINGQYLLFVGTIQPRKNLVRLIEAFARYSFEVDLVLAGKPGWLADDIYQAPKKFGVEAKVRFLNYVNDEDLSILYWGALAFIFPSLYEGFGLPVLEAMASGVPVVCSNSSSIPEVAGDAALYFNPQNPEDMAEKLQLIIKDAKLREKLVGLGEKQVQKFSWQKCAEETLKVFEKVYNIKHV